MSIFEESILEKDKGGGNFLRLEEILSTNLIIKKIEIITAQNPKFGATDTDALFKRGVLMEGETLRYSFVVNDEERFFESKGMAFYIGFKQSGVKDEAMVEISRTGSGDSTRYQVKAVIN